MEYSELNFGKHKGRTLPQVIISDPAWFFWAYNENILKERGYSREADDVCKKARNIKIPKDQPENFKAVYIRHFTGGFGGIQIVPKDQYIIKNFKTTVGHIDLMKAWVSLNGKDRTGMDILKMSLKEILFQDIKVILTRKKCDEFFETDDNFLINN